MNDNKGISLIEILIAVGLVIVVAGALIQLGITTLKTSDAARIRSIAQELADEGLDYARYLRDTNPSDFFNKSGNYAVNLNGSGEFSVTACTPGNESTIAESCLVPDVYVNNSPVKVYRIIHIEDYNGTSDAKEVTVYVYWLSGGSGDGSSNLYSSLETGTVLTKWRS